MQIVIQAKGIILTTGMRKHVERRIGFALDWAKYHTRKISVRLSDVNGPRGGRDKCCHIQVIIPGVADVITENIAEDIYVAIDWAVKRAGRALVRQVERNREYRHEIPSGIDAIAPLAVSLN